MIKGENERSKDKITLPDLLEQAGLSELSQAPSGEIARGWLRNYGRHAPAKSVDRLLFREQGVAYLNRVGLGSPASMIDAALDEAVIPGKTAPEPAPNRTEGQLLEEARSVLDAEDHLVRFQAALHAEGFAGDTAGAELLYLALTSRFMDRPTNVVVRGPSGSGKSYLVKSVLAFHPDEAANRLTAASQKALLYTQFDTEHAFVVISEGDALFREGVGATVIRELTWSASLRYEVSVATSEGVQNQVIEKPGPTGLITTSTRGLEPELSTRLLEVHVSATEEQTGAILESLGQKAAGFVESSPDRTPWHAAQTWLGQHGKRQVAIPFAPSLCRVVPTDRLRMRRDFEQVLSLIKTHAFLHQRYRQMDEKGRVVADERDYEVVRRLLTHVFQSNRRDDLTAADRKLIDAVDKLNSELPAGAEPGVSGNDLADCLEIHKSGVSRRATRLEEEGHIENLEKWNGSECRYVVRRAAPQEDSVLPPPEVLFQAAKGQRAA